MADSSQVAMYYKAESSYATVAGGNGLQLDYVSENLEGKHDTKESDEVVSSREIAGYALVDAMADGSINCRMKFGGHDDLIQWALMTSAWAGAVNVTPGTTFAAVASGNHITDSGSSMGSLTVGSWIRIAGFATAGNNGYAKILTAAAGDITISGLTLVNESAGATVTIKQADKITNGTTLASMTLERKYSDLSNIFVYYPGAVIDAWDLKVSLKDFISQTFGFKAKDEINATSTQMGTPTVPSTADILTAVTSPTKFYQGGVATANLLSILDFTSKVENNLRMRENIGVLGLASIGLGDCRVTGTMKVYFTDNVLSALFLADTYTSCAILLKDPSTLKGYLLEFPSIKFRTDKRPGEGKNKDVIQDMTWGARKDPTAGYTLRIHRFN